MTTVFGQTSISGLIDEITMASGSIQFNGTNQYLTIPTNTAFDFGTGDLTIECWIYNSTISGTSNIYSARNASSNGISFRRNGSKIDFFLDNSGTGVFTGTTTLVVNTWYHVALTRSGNIFRIWVNGILDGTSATLTQSVTSVNNPWIGAARSGIGEYFSGYISNLHIVKGTALYTSNFIPPQGPIKRMANTSLLLDMQPCIPFGDDSVNNFTITSVNAPLFNNVGPYNPAPPSTGTSQNIPMKQLKDGTVMLSGYYDECGPNYVTPGAFIAGLYKTTYVGYFSDTPTWFATATPGAYGANPATSVQTTVIEEPTSDDGSNFSVQWLGYFLPSTTETYTFYTSSDDGSYMWIGANALSPTTVNATVSNGGAHGQSEVSGTIALTAGVYYPIRIQFGEIGGGDVMTFNFSTPTITKTTTVTGRVFYNPATNGF